MSLKDRFANHSDTPAEQPQPEEQKSVELYDTPGHARNICFVQADGSMTFLNYAYLVSSQINNQFDLIYLVFTTHEVTIRGVNLSEIFFHLLESQARIIFEQNKRYISLEDKAKFQISEIAIKMI